nr:hypothetical protein [Aneurinibacillus terranovensis]
MSLYTSFLYEGRSWNNGNVLFIKSYYISANTKHNKQLAHDCGAHNHKMTSSDSIVTKDILCEERNTYTENQETRVHKTSSPEKKIALFCSIFQGRTDERLKATLRWAIE